MDQLTLLIGAIVILGLGFLLYLKITKTIMKLVIFVIGIVILAVLALIYRDQLPF